MPVRSLKEMWGLILLAQNPDSATFSRFKAAQGDWAPEKCGRRDGSSSMGGGGRQGGSSGKWWAMTCWQRGGAETGATQFQLSLLAGKWDNIGRDYL